MEIPINVTEDERLGCMTISIPGLPIYGEGETSDEAIQKLLIDVIEFCAAYVEKIELYKRSESALNQSIMETLLSCGNDKAAIRVVLNV